MHLPVIICTVVHVPGNDENFASKTIPVISRCCFSIFLEVALSKSTIHGTTNGRNGHYYPGTATLDSPRGRAQTTASSTAGISRWPPYKNDLVAKSVAVFNYHEDFSDRGTGN